MKLIHIYPQESWHMDAYIVANREGLQALKEAIDEALDRENAEVEAFVSDGEGYEIEIILNDSPWGSTFWKQVAVPYTADYAKEKREDVVWPMNLTPSPAGSNG